MRLGEELHTHTESMMKCYSVTWIQRDIRQSLLLFFLHMHTHEDFSVTATANHFPGQ